MKTLTVLTCAILIAPTVYAADTDCFFSSYGHTSDSECSMQTQAPMFDTNTTGCDTIAYAYVGCANTRYNPGYQSKCDEAATWFAPFQHCTKCKSGYQLTKRYRFQDLIAYTLSSCQQYCTSTNFYIEYDECEKCAIPCSSTTSWLTSNGKTGYERRTVCSSGCGTYEYRCAAGYYGKPTNDTSGCTKCPSSGNVAGQSVAGSNSAITSCYIPANTSLSDSTGTYQYTSNCYYSN